MAGIAPPTCYRRVPTCEILATTDPLRGSSLWLRGLQAALQAAPSLAWSCPRYAISDGEFGDCKGTVFLIAKGRFF